MTRPRTAHYRINTINAKPIHLYHLLVKFAEEWDQKSLTKLLLFKSGFSRVYISVSATRWYTLTDSNDPDWPGDAESILTRDKNFTCHRIISRPKPEGNWMGKWRTFDTKEELEKFAKRMIAQLTACGNV